MTVNRDPGILKNMKKPLLTGTEVELLKLFPIDNLSLVPKSIDTTCIKINNKNKNKNKVLPSEIYSSSQEKGLLLARMVDMKLLSGENAKPIYSLDFCVETENPSDNKDFSYQPGDSFGFYPELSGEEVEYLAGRLEISLEALIEISGPPKILNDLLPRYKLEESPGGNGEGSSLVVKTCELLGRLDFRGFPKKAVLRTLAEFCQEEAEASMLLFLSSRAGSDAYNRLRSEMLSVRLLLSALDSLKPPLQALVNILGPMQPRFYSCCRMQNVAHKNLFQIVFNVNEVAPESASEMKIRGVASGWLESLGKKIINQEPQKMERILLTIQQRSLTNFRLPEKIDGRPIIMIGAGTGVAPFIGFLDRLQQLKATKNQNSFPFSWLIFGFRNLNEDFIFKKELQEFKADCTLSKLSLAVSRDPMQPKTYVQDIIRAESEEFFRLLYNEDAICYICGDELTMIKGVNEAIVEILLLAKTELNRNDAEVLLLKWTREKKIIRDIWV